MKTPFFDPSEFKGKLRFTVENNPISKDYKPPVNLYKNEDMPYDYVSLRMDLFINKSKMN